MGNRAIVVFANAAFTEFSPAVYLHWNGGAESVYAFLDELDRRSIRADQDYECARFIQIVGEFMDSDYRSTTSLGVLNGPKTLREAANMSPGDNGVYVVCREGGRVVRRWDDGGEDGIGEYAPERVAEELRYAMAHKYRTGKSPIQESWGKKLTEDAHFNRREKTRDKARNAGATP